MTTASSGCVNEKFLRQEVVMGIRAHAILGSESSLENPLWFG
jgi:hypothetical protein